ncbi:MAG TPA: mechanosensitive ion channel family protein [Smithellaceae bacterium]|nr:mechanosensitive ion channel family protein [Smithellaceae bacterium]
MPENINYVSLLIDFIKAYGTKILSAIIILIVGYFIGRWIAKAFDKKLQERNLEPPIRLLLVRVLHIVVILLALLLAVQNIGIEIMPIIAGLGVAGIGIGFATQGVLSNVVAGLTIIFSKPYRVGEYIELLGVYGEVVSIELFSTTLIHADHSRVIIPNRKIVGEILHNYGNMRQCNLTINIAYSADIKRAIDVIGEVLRNNPKVLPEPAPLVGVMTLTGSAIQLAVKPWVTVKEFGLVESGIYQEIISRFRAQQIGISLPQQEIRILGNNV